LCPYQITPSIKNAGVESLSRMIVFLNKIIFFDELGIFMISKDIKGDKLATIKDLSDISDDSDYFSGFIFEGDEWDEDLEGYIVGNDHYSGDDEALFLSFNMNLYFRDYLKYSTTHFDTTEGKISIDVSVKLNLTDDISIDLKEFSCGESGSWYYSEDAQDHGDGPEINLNEKFNELIKELLEFVKNLPDNININDTDKFIKKFQAQKEKIEEIEKEIKKTEEINEKLKSKKEKEIQKLEEIKENIGKTVKY
jgi:hypothetical protein